MTMELCCGGCGGRLLVETTGVIVACPHCGIHLSIPDPPSIPDSESPPAAPQGSPSTSDPQPSVMATQSDPLKSPQPTDTPSPPDIPAIVGEQGPASSVFNAGDDETPVAPVEIGWLSSPNLSLSEATGSPLQSFAQLESSPDASATPVHDEVNPSEVPVDSFIKEETSTTSPEPTGFNFNAASWAKPSGPPTASFGGFPEFGQPNPASEVTPEPSNSFLTGENPESLATDSVSAPLPVDLEPNSRLKLLLMIVGSYASLATLILIYLFFFGRAHQLESLPDLKTVPQMGGRAVIPRPENDLPWGHQLRFGQTQQYGNIRVTPLRVTRGSISFEHQSGDSSEQRTPTEPVLKLWLRFENLSASEEITPLDTTLMFFRLPVEHRTASYNVIFREADQRKKDAQLWYPFDRMSVNSEWLIVGQHTNESLTPKSSLVTFVPSEENVNGLTGEIVWRVHFRKGYGPRTGNGVTTLVDVHFNSDEIKPDHT